MSSRSDVFEHAPTSVLTAAGPLSEQAAANRAIDGLRAVAIVGVMGFHAGTPGFAAGWLGVELFFVLSGFLITTLLVKEYERTGEIRLKHFWLRRVLRLVPAYWLYAALLTYLLWGLDIGWRQSHGGFDANHYTAAIWLYFVNMLPLGGIWEHQDLSLHLWSLSVEEQFYLLWPIVCYFLIKRGRLELVAWSLTGIALFQTWKNPNVAELARLDTRGFAIMLGCATALRVARSAALRSWLRTPRPWIFLVTAVAWTGAASAAHFGWVSDVHLHVFGGVLMSVVFALTIAHLWLNTQGYAAGLLSAEPVAYIGRISYGLYLYHMAAHYLTWHVALDSIEHWNRWAKTLVRLSTYFGITVAMAVMSYHWLELPFLRLKRHFR